MLTCRLFRSLDEGGDFTGIGQLKSGKCMGNREIIRGWEKGKERGGADA